jgi:hypothetical protein
MTKILIFLIAITCLLVLLARHEGFLPYPAAPITIKVVGTTTNQGKGDFPGSASGPPPSSSLFIETLQGFDAANARVSGCFEDSVIPISNDENMRTIKCAEPQTDVPFFGPGAPSNNDTIWLLYWLPVNAATPNEPSRPLAHSAYASYGACWLALKRLDAEVRATFSENVETAIKAHSTPPTYDSTPSYCKALKNTPAPPAR